MDPAIVATLIGVLGTALIGVAAGAFHLLRSDIRRVEGKLDGLVLALGALGVSDRPSVAGAACELHAGLGRLGLEG